MIRRLAVLVALVLIASCSAFAPSRNVVHTQMMTASTSTQLHEKRTWNFNEGRSPWGLKNNAEIWNGRVAQMAFTLIFLQELIQGHGVVEGIRDGDFVNYAFLGFFAVGVTGLTAWLALQGDDKFVDSI